MVRRVSPRIALSVAAILALGFSAAALVPPLVAHGFPAGHDTPAHLTYVYLFDAALAQGQFPVRWVEWVRPGHSQPLFNFYQPGFYYAVQLVHALVPSLLLSTKLTVLCAWLGGSAFVYLYLRPLGAWPAALGALLFMRTPYLILDVFVRAAFPELLALACAPAVLWSLDRVLRSGSATHAMALAAATAAMLVCHLPTVLMFVPVFATYAGCMWLSRLSRTASVVRVAVAVAVGLGIAGFYVVPALVELRFTRMADLTSAYFDYRRHFVEPWQWFSRAWGYGASDAGSADGMSFQVGIVQWLALGAGAAAATVAVRRRRPDLAGPLLYWLCVAGASLLMTVTASTVIWRAVPPLAFVQFPWRFLTVVSLAVCIVAALALSSIRSSALRAAMVLCAAGGLWWQTHALLRPSHYFPRGWVFIDDAGWRYGRGASRLAFIEPGYYPAAVLRLPEDYVERWRITRGAGVVSPRTVLDHRLVLDVTSDEGVELTITSHGFPGWRVLINDSDVPWRYAPELGFIVVDVPPGARIVDAAFTDTPVRAWANRISTMSVVLWGASALGVAAGRVRARRRRARQPPVVT